MDINDLIRHYPMLYHMAAPGSWDSIRANGLMTTEQLVHACMPGDEVRREVLEDVRKRSIALQHPGGYQVLVRDQAPLRAPFRERVLIDVTLLEWLNTLNNRVFFWLQPSRLSDLLNAQRYRGSAHDVLTVDTASLVKAHQANVRLSAINSGATLYPNATPRGSMTFQAIDDYRFMIGPNGGVRTPIAELAVIGGVPDIIQHVVRVERRKGDSVLKQLVP